MKIFNLIYSLDGINKPTPSKIVKWSMAYLAAINFAGTYSLFQGNHKFATLMYSIGFIATFLSAFFSDEEKQNVNQ